MARFDRLDYVILFVADLEPAIEFFRDVIGLDLKLAEHGYAEFVTSGTKLALYEQARLPSLIGRFPTGGGPAGEIVFLVSDVEAEAKRLRGLGATILAGPEDRLWGHRTLHVAGPGEIVVELAQEIPRAR